MELTNNRQLFTVINTSTSVKLNGEITIADKKLITSFNGNFSSLENSTVEDPTLMNNKFLGNFNYSESADTFNKNISGKTKEQADEINTLLDETITQIKTQLGL